MNGNRNRDELKHANHSAIEAFRVASWFEDERRCPLTSQIYYLRAAKAGYPPAMIKLASICLSAKTGNGNKEEAGATEAAMWLMRAASSGNCIADYLLARCYVDGIGVKENRPRAKYYLKKSCRYEKRLSKYRPMEAFVFGSVSQKLQDLEKEMIQK